jgi:uncharacterized protein YbbK (DUF523 family)
VSYILREKIRVGVSACNAGARVRWNRAGWDRLAPLGREMSQFVWTPVCPEVMAGLGVPRDPIRVVGNSGTDFWKGKAKVKSRRGRDVSEPLQQAALACLDALKRAEAEAFVFMEGSPSCGVYRTTLSGKRLGKPPGVFGALLIREDLFLIPAVDLDSPVKWWDWRRRLHAFCWLRRQELASKAQVYDIWHHFKFLCQEVDDRQARAIGARLAGMPKQFDPASVAQWKSDTLRLLRTPSTLKRILGVMQKHYAHYRKQFKPGAKDVQAPTSWDAKRRIVEELLAMEKRAVLEGYDFGGAPVVYRGR